MALADHLGLTAHDASAVQAVRPPPVAAGRAGGRSGSRFATQLAAWCDEWDACLE